MASGSARRAQGRRWRHLECRRWRHVWAAALVCRVALVPGAYSDTEWTRALIPIRSGDYFADYRDYFSRQGCQVLTVALSADATCEVRALQLRDQIARWNRGHEAEAYTLIAHSQGGLDARFAIAILGLRPRALLTIGTPHLGSGVAEWIQAPTASRWVLGKFLSLGGYDLGALSFPAEMTGAFLRERSRYFALRPEVRYGAAQGHCRTHCHWGLRFLAWWKAGGGDGLVSVVSQRGEPGVEDLGSFDLDHLSEVGVDWRKKPERTRLLEVLGARVRNEVANPPAVR